MTYRVTTATDGLSGFDILDASDGMLVEHVTDEHSPVLSSLPAYVREWVADLSQDRIAEELSKPGGLAMDRYDELCRVARRELEEVK